MRIGTMHLADGLEFQAVAVMACDDHQNGSVPKYGDAAAGDVHDPQFKTSGSGPTYISFDVDSLDPGFAPGTGTPEAGGLAPREAMELVRGAAGLDVVGGDVVEVAPQYDATTNTAHAAAQMLFEIFAVVALARTAAAKPGSGRSRKGARGR